MGVLTTVVKVCLLSISALSFPAMNKQDKLTVSTGILSQREGRNGEFEPKRSKPSIVEPKPNQPELSSMHEKELSRTPKESDQIPTRLDIELEEECIISSKGVLEASSEFCWASHIKEEHT